MGNKKKKHSSSKSQGPLTPQRFAPHQPRNLPESLLQDLGETSLSVVIIAVLSWYVTSAT